MSGNYNKQNKGMAKMNAKLILKDVGGHQGLREIDLTSGKISIFAGKNYSGKSTIIKSLAAAISCPIKSENIINEAIKFGILPMKSKKSPIINAFKDKAMISLSYNQEKIELILNKDGTVKTNHKGNENFLYAAMLVKNSKIQEYITTGNDNFQWIVSEMSSAGAYEQLKSKINSYISINENAINYIDSIKNQLSDYLRKIDSLTQEKLNLDNELKYVQEEKAKIDISQFPELEKLQKDKKDVNAEIKKKNALKKTEEKKLNKFQSEIEQEDKKVADYTIEISKIQQEIDSIEKEIISLKEIKKNRNFEEEKDKLQEKLNIISAEQGKLDLYGTIYEVLIKASLEQGTCPVCESKVTLTEEFFVKKLEEIRDKRGEILKEKEKIYFKIDDLNNIKAEIQKIKHKEGARDESKTKMGQMKKIIENAEEQKIMKRKELKTINENINSIQNDINKLEKNLEKISADIKKFDIMRPFEEKEKEINDSIKKIEIDIEKYKELIKEKSFIEFLDIMIPLEKAESITSKLENELEKIDTYLIDKMNEQRLGAGKKFNTYIKNIMKNLELQEFEDIYINLEDYHLTVVRKGGAIQELGSLSGAERALIGAILQISCKKTYLENVPFFIGDDLFLEFSPQNQKKFFEYLKELTVEDDLFVVLTRVTDDPIEKIEI